MKKLMIAAAALMIACAASYGQGYFTLNTRQNSGANELMFTLNGAPASGSDIFAEALAGPDAQHLTPLTPLFPINRTGAGAGLANPFSQVLTVPNMGGGTATVAIRAFQGTSFATATAASPQVTLGTVALNVAPNLPAELTLPAGVTTIGLVPIPEPTTLALGLLGVGTLLAFRRRN